jgi:predicted nucleotidyltransferase
LALKVERDNRKTLRHSVQVPDVNVRERVPDEAIEDVARQIVQHFHPCQIILFGSYAYGRPHPGSDVDLLVVMNTPLKETEQAIRISQAIEYHFGLDLIVRTPAKLSERLALGDHFLREVMTKGKILYDEQIDGRVGRKSGG